MARAVLVAAAAAVLAIAAVGAGARAAATPSITIHAEFVAAESATHYTLIFTNELPGEVPVVFWSLTIVQIDPDGQVDPTCTKTSLGATSDEFVWHHAASDGCEHKKEGTRGHQGRISVDAQFKDWDCKTTYDGTTGVPPDGPTALCRPLQPPPPSTDPCEAQRTKVAQLTAELQAAKASLRRVQLQYYVSYSAKYAAQSRYYAASRSDAKALQDALDAWGAAYRDYLRIRSAYRTVTARVQRLTVALAAAEKALKECEASHRPAAHLGPSACSSEHFAAATARGRAAGYADVVVPLRGQPLADAAAKLRLAAAGFATAAQQLPRLRSRLLASAAKARATASRLDATIAALGRLDASRAAAAKAAAAAQATLAKCLSGGG